MTDKKYPQNEYNQRWNDKNREHRRYLSYKGTSKTFIRNYATAEDLDQLENLIKEKREK